MIQVLGEMSNNGLPNRKFSQTFFLAKQPNGYYVLNDIFRYLKDDEDTEEGEYDEYIAEEVAEDAEVAEAIAEEVIEATEDMSLKETTTEAEVEVQENKVAIEEIATIEPALPIQETQGLPPPINGSANGSSVETLEEKPEVEVQPDPEPEPEPKAEEPALPPVEAVAEEPAPPVIEEKKPAPTPEKEPERRAVTPIPATPPVPAGPPKPTTWALVAKSGNTGTPPAVPQSVTPPQVQQPQQTQPPQAQNSTTPATSSTASSATPSTPTTPRGGSQWHVTENKRHPRPAPGSANAPAGQTPAYVRNVTEGVSDRALEEALNKFGLSGKVEIIRPKVKIASSFYLRVGG